MSDEFLTPRRTSELLKVTTKTLQNWDKDGKIKSFRTTGGHRRFALADIRALMQTEQVPITQTKICYCRVSTPSQKEDLERQVEFFRTTYPTHRIIKDIGSGLNFKRKGLQTILDIAIAGDLAEVVVTHRDRLCRFGFELIEGIISKHSDGKIVVLDKPKTSPESELTTDLISIITVFSARLHGLRNHSIRKKIREATKDNEISSSSDTGGKGVSPDTNGKVQVVL